MPNISDMVAKVNKFGFIQSNNYRIIFSGIVGQADEVVGAPSTSGAWNNRMSLSCDNITVPGRSLSTSEFKTIGISRELPYERLYSGDISMTFLFGRDMLERKIFETWMDFICNPVTNRFSYYDDYTATADIILYDTTESPVYKVRVDEIFPKEISSVDLNNDSSELAKQTITFSFRSYIPIDVSVEGESSTTPEGLHNNSAWQTFANGLGPFDNVVGADILNWVNSSTSYYEKFAEGGRVVEKLVSRPNLKNLFGKMI